MEPQKSSLIDSISGHHLKSNGMHSNGTFESNRALSNSVLSHSLSNSLTHPLTDSHSKTHSPPFVLAVRSPSSFVASFVLCFQVLGSLFFSFFNAIFCFVSWVIVNLSSFLFWVLQILDSSNFGFLQVSLVGELNLVLFVLFGFWELMA